MEECDNLKMAQCENELANVMTSSVIHDGENDNEISKWKPKAQ